MGVCCCRLPWCARLRVGNGVPLQPVLDDYLTESELAAGCQEQNESLRCSLKEDALSRASMQSCLDDVVLGRMRKHTDWEQQSLPQDAIVTPRFSIEQGVRKDGSVKHRPIDDFTRSRCNSATIPTERLRYDSLDTFLGALQQAHGSYEDELALFKVDIDAAFRRVPIMPEHRRFAWVGFLLWGRAHAFQHLSMPFGAIAAVHSWDRIGSMRSTQ